MFLFYDKILRASFCGPNTSKSNNNEGPSGITGTFTNTHKNKFIDTFNDGFKNTNPNKFTENFPDGLQNAYTNSFLSKSETFVSENVVNIGNSNVEQVGVTICKENQSIVISRILKGSLADKTGRGVRSKMKCLEKLKVGDEILEINKIPIKGLSVEDVMDILEREKAFGISFLIKSIVNYEENVSLCVDTGNVVQ